MSKTIISHHHYHNNSSSFTLIELLVVIAILAILMAVVVVAINPSEMFKKTRDTRRSSDLKTLNDAISYFQVSLPDAPLGNLKTVYVSIPDTSPTCTNLGLPLLPSGWSYQCSTVDNYQKVDGTGWIPVNFKQMDIGTPLSVLPIDPINQTSTGNYYTYVVGGSWEISAIFESQKYLQEVALNDGGDSDNGYEVGSNLTLSPLIFPHNWIKVPGNSTYNTSDFWVMKYEAKYSINGSGVNDANSCRYTSVYDTWDWGKSGTDCPSSWSNINVVSSPYGSPIAGVTHTDAITICQSLGGHLITNDEWMTIARNAEQVKENWSGSSVGSGCLFRGNVGSNDSCGYNGADPEKGLNRNPKAKLILSNKEEIWDIAGNVWEHVMKDTNDTLVRYTPSDGGSTGWRWIEHTAIVNYGDFTYNEIRPSNDSWNATQGMGRIYTYNGDTGSQSRVLLRGGGDWSYGSNAGAFALHLNWDTSAQHSYVGLRCAR